MGIWDAVSSTVDAVRNRLPDPAPVKDAYSAVADKLRRGAPDMRTPIAGILSSSYNHGRSALSTVGKAARAERVKESMPDKEALAKIGWSLTDIALDKYTRIYTDHHGPPRINIWEDPMSPSKWKEEHFVLASLSGWGLLIYGGLKAFGGNKEKKEEVIAAAAH